MIKKLIITSCAIVFAAFSLTAQDEMEMGGPPPKKKKKTKNEIVSPERHKYTEVHKKHQKQIVFSNSEIKKGEENTAAFVNTWQMGEPLYFRSFCSQTLLESVYDYAEKEGSEFNEYDYASFSEHIAVFINGKEMAYYENASKDQDYVNNWVTRSGYIYDASQDKKTSGYLSNAIGLAFQAMGDNFKEGTYDVEIKIYAMPSVLGGNVDRDKSQRHALMNSGKIKVIVTKEGMNKFAPYLCRNILKRSGQMEDTALEDQIAQAFGRAYGYKGITANILDSDWSIKRNGFGVVLFRFITTEVAFTDKENETRIMEITVKQDHDGTKFQSSVAPYTLTYERPYCSFCTNYKKK